MTGTGQREKPVLAIDLGGTKIIAALISRQGEMLAREYSLTHASDGPEAVIGRLFSAIEHVLDSQRMPSSQLHSISLAIAGAIDSSNGIVTLSPNLPGWRNVPLKSIVEEKYGVKTFLLNDANAAALGEHRFGAGKGAKNLIYMTVSTGIGGGIIINGELYEGASGGAGEIGHMIIDMNGPKCNCGNTGCLEMLASGTAVAREAIRRLGQGEESALTGMVEGNLENITAEIVGTAAQNGDGLALEVVNQAATYLGVGLTNLVNIFNPEVVVIGGGLVKMGDLLLGPARRVVRERAFPLLVRAVRIVTARLGDDTGVFGAAVFAYQQSVN
ncbi:MAG: ROK family protein [Chloroflexi bacterium]|nr:ROK family protein [Chloroflexota bacterium]